MDILNSDVHILLLEKMDPIEVIQACQVDRAFRHACNAPGTFERLLDAHFPEEQKDADVKASDLYKSLAAKRGSRWYVKTEVDIEPGIVDVKFEPVAVQVTADEARVLRNNGDDFYNIMQVPGLDLPRGLRYAWCNIDHFGEIIWRWHYANSLEDAIADFMKLYGNDISESIRSNFEDEAEYLAYLEEEQIPDLRNLEVLTEHIKTKGRFEMPSDAFVFTEMEYTARK